MKRFIISALLTILALSCFAQQKVYKATVFGAKSDGITDNTATIQRAIDFISQNGGGTLVFYVGRYLTGSVQLKDNVTIDLQEAAVLVGSTNIYSYKGASALVWADGAQNIGITGKGVIEGRHSALKANIDGQVAKGYLPAGTAVPALVSGVGTGAEVKLVEDKVVK